ncbi:MAG: pantetheine-phosphate adenylyltransferase [Tannerella sp.]|jgi:pantetheine-phosphate adenylyltransferase|nr:pantetheine-phosphate adenylyltransferase [Tannerella sp.]
MEKKALFSGTFDPFTIGHYSLIKRALHFTGEIVIAIGVNYEKKTFYSLEERIHTIQQIYAKEQRVKVMSYDILTVDLAKEIKADFLLRGVRNIYDFEYEKNLADINRKLANMETIILISEPEYEHVSSSLIRELIYYKKDISHLIPIIK